MAISSSSSPPSRLAGGRINYPATVAMFERMGLAREALAVKPIIRLSALLFELERILALKTEHNSVNESTRRVIWSKSYQLLASSLVDGSRNHSSNPISRGRSWFWGEWHCRRSLCMSASLWQRLDNDSSSVTELGRNSLWRTKWQATQHIASNTCVSLRLLAALGSHLWNAILIVLWYFLLLSKQATKWWKSLHVTQDDKIVNKLTADAHCSQKILSSIGAHQISLYCDSRMPEQDCKACVLSKKLNEEFTLIVCHRIHHQNTNINQNGFAWAKANPMNIKFRAVIIQPMFSPTKSNNYKSESHFITVHSEWLALRKVINRSTCYYEVSNIIVKIIWNLKI